MENKPYADKQSCPVEDLHLDRRVFAQIVASGLMITIATPAFAQQRRGQGRARPVSARLVLNKDGTITALSGKVEEGQGPRAELSQAVAEELRVAVDRIRLVMADTDLVPDDGVTAGSRTTPRNVPQMRVAAATAREMLTDFAAQKWNLDPSQLELRDGVIAGPAPEQRMSYADLAQMEDVSALLTRDVRAGTAIGPVESWQVLGKSVRRPNGRDLVTGAHRFPADVQRPGMLHGKVLRPPAYGAILESVDLAAAYAMSDVVVVHEDQFVAVAASSSFRARQALDAMAKTAKWKHSAPAVSNANLFTHLKENASGRERTTTRGEADPAMSAAAKVLEREFEIAYIQHVPMEPRAAVAEWSGDRVTVWVGCDGPFRARGTVARELGVPDEQVRVIVPDMGGGFGGKHTAEPAVEAARLARAAGKPVSVRWTRQEEFTWAYCRPAAVIECKAGLDAGGSVAAWQFKNINAGGSAVDTPYAIPNTTITTVGSASPLPQGSYRGLGSSCNNFARESVMDDLAAVAGKDPLAFRLAQLENPRLRRVLEKAASEFGWAARRNAVTPELGVGLACGTEKNSVVAACVEVALDRQAGTIRVTEICQAFEAGPILDPDNLRAQVQGCILMGLGGALTEELEFENGAILNPRFARYLVPRFQDVPPKVDVHLVEDRTINPAGGGETPIIAVAPAIGNAVFAATGIRLRSMPMRGEEIRGG